MKSVPSGGGVEHSTPGLRNAQRPGFYRSCASISKAIVAEGGETADDRIRFVYRVCLAREPSSDDAETLSDIFDKARALYFRDPESATKMACDPLGPASKTMDVVELAAWTVVANVVMNLDEFLMRK